MKRLALTVGIVGGWEVWEVEVEDGTNPQDVLDGKADYEVVEVLDAGFDGAELEAAQEMLK